MANFTKNRYFFELIGQVTCTASLHGDFYLYSLAALNIFLSMTASLGNILILVALRKESSLHPQSKLLFRCLALTDLFVGVSAQPLFTVQLMSIAHQRLQLCYIVANINDIAGRSLIAVSLCTLTAISVDRLLVLLLGLRYRQKVTLRRMRGTVISMWILNIALSSCLRLLSRAIISWVTSALIYTLLVTSDFCYMKIYLSLRRHEVKMQDHVHQGQRNRGGIALNIARYRKTVSAALWVQLTLVACYLPYGIAAPIAHPYTSSHNLFTRLTLTLLLLNSSLNPFLYCWKMRGVRQAMKETIKQLCSCSC